MHSDALRRQRSNSSPSFDAQGHDLKVDDDIVSKVRVASRSGFFESARVESREGQYRCTAQPGGRCRRYYVFDVKVKVSPAADTDDADARVAHSARALLASSSSPSRRRRKISEKSHHRHRRRRLKTKRKKKKKKKKKKKTPSSHWEFYPLICTGNCWCKKAGP